ncbi:MAG TPA: hypothetical protein VH575_32160 [Gemmataceae bacterium]|jgi:hypothetical protein
MVAPRLFPGTTLAEARDVADTLGWTEAVEKRAREEAKSHPVESRAAAYRWGFIYWLYVYMRQSPMSEKDFTDEELAFLDHADEDEAD